MFNVNLTAFCILSFVYSASTFACAVPGMGPEFDKHIAIEKIGKNKFRATVSKEAEGLKYGVEAVVQYYPADSDHRIGEYLKNVYPTREDDTNYIFIFELKKIEEYIPYLHVFWLPEVCCLCGAFGSSNDIALE